MEAWMAVGLMCACGPTSEVDSGGDTAGESSDDGDDDDDDDDDDSVESTDTGGSDEGASSGDATTGDDGSESTTSGDDDDDDDDDDTTGTGEPVGLCSEDGHFGLTVTGSELDDYDGMIVWAAAVSPTGIGEDVEHVVVVNIEGTITGGAFELSCPTGLEEAANYPSLAAIIDADASGDCSDGDVGVLLQLFAWLDAQTLTVDTMSLVAVGDMNTFDGSPACDYYF